MRTRLARLALLAAFALVVTFGVARAEEVGAGCPQVVAGSDLFANQTLVPAAEPELDLAQVEKGGGYSCLGQLCQNTAQCYQTCWGDAFKCHKDNATQRWGVCVLQ